MLSRKREVELSELAESIANYYFPTGSIEPSAIAEKKGITYTYGNYGNSFDGLIEQENGHFHIFINTINYSAAHVRSRFTFGHELGHYFIDEHRRALLCGRTPSHPSKIDFSSKNLVELEADYFASSLLLPESRIKQDCLKKPFTFKLVEHLSEKYKTSITATLLKLMTIDKHPIMLVCSENERIKWFKHSHDFPFKWLKKPIGIVPKNTLAGAYFATKEKFNEELPITANDWFEYVPGWQIDRPFFEKCIYSDRHNFVLSIIWEK
ncbi:ImmA/IrrE family metallo-endopeptidase [Foetidibacter luteolus]|uniref:ImmA/IrrE family metallo-endopeptidase n=1 Tax=Foetidibacter luteolus TaxID=2608880 RepID=UPI00129BB7A1|nr:ImmA/IrrE family metallo-endopeptidase [Foetidibacter luteolus]